MVKNILIGVVAFIVVLVGLVVIAPSFIDSQAIKREITTQARNATGRELTIDGNLEIRVIPSPTLIANNVRLSNAKGGKAQHMVALEAVEVRVALSPLLSGQVKVEQIRLVSPEIHVETYADGRNNLEFEKPVQPSEVPKTAAPSQTTTSGENGGGSGNELDIRLDNFEIVGGRVVYTDMKTGAHEEVEAIDATLRAVSLNGPFEAIGQARVRGIPTAFEMSLGQIIKQRTVPVNAVVQASAGTKLQVSGGIFGLEATPHFKGSIKGGGQNLSQLLDSVLGAGTAPQELAQTFGVETQIDASAKALDLKELEIQLGASRITGGVNVTLDQGVDFKVDLKSSLVDLDAFSSQTQSKAGGTDLKGAAANSSPTLSPTPPKASASQTQSKQNFAFPKDVRGSVQLRVGAIAFKGDMISDVQVAAELADGELTLSQFQAMAPGVTDIAVFGFVAPKDGAPQFQGNVEMTTSSPQTLTNWLGVQLPPEIAERVKRVSYESKITADPKQVVVSDLVVKADKSTLSGGVTLALRDRLSFGADLTLDRINLDTYLNGKGRPVTPVQQEGSEAVTPVDGSVMETQSGPEAVKQTAKQTDLGQALSVFSALNTFDANMTFRVKSLVHQGEALKNFLFDGTLYAGKLDLRSLKVGDFMGVRTNVSGAFSGFGGIPELTNVKLDANVKNLARLATDLGIADVPLGLKTVALNGVVNGSVLQPRLDTKVTVLGGTVASKGRLSLLPIGFGYDGTLDTSFKNLEGVLKALAVDYSPKGPMGTLKLTAKVKSDGKTHTISAMQSTLGKTAINGDVSVATAGVKPRITADLQTGGLVLDRFMPREQKNAAVQPLNNDRGSRFGKVASIKNDNVVYASFGKDQLALADKRWSREKFDLSVLNTLDGDVTLKSDFIQFGDYKLDNADIHATVSNGVLNANRVKGTLFGGPVTGTAVVRAEGTPTIETDIKLDALKIGQAVKAVTGKDMADGALSLGLNFNASGLSPADLVSTLAGNGNLDINALDVKKDGKGSALSGIIGLVAAMNKLSLNQKKGKGLADLTMAFGLENGVATATKMALTSSMGNGSGSGKIDIANWAIDVAGDMTVEANLLTTLLSKGKVGRQQVPFSLKGALDNPGVKLGVLPGGGQTKPGPVEKIDPFKSLIEKALPGVKLPSKKSTQPSTPTNPSQQDGTLAPPPPQSGSSQPSNNNTKPDARDLLKGLLRGL
ncbi:MAG: AsmA family protein [Magnetovibrio sp.]|nr:AsmA family protein [Magnetovibrio sp.]